MLILGIIGLTASYVTVGLAVARWTYRKYVDSWRPHYSGVDWERIERLSDDRMRFIKPLGFFLFWPPILVGLLLAGLWKSTVMRETPGQKKERLEKQARELEKQAKEAERVYQQYLKELE